MTKHIIFPLGALNKKTKEYVYPIVANKIDDYVCPDCDRDLILCRGDVYKTYFRHRSDANIKCTYYNKPSETQIHKDAILLMKKILEDNISIVMLRECECCNEVEEFIIPKLNINSKIHTEYKFEFNGNNKKADIVYLYKNKIIFIFEICNTHKINNFDRPEPWFEIDANELITMVNTTKIHTQLEINCIRTKKCDNCITEEKEKIHIKEINSLKLEKKIRKRLGQTLFPKTYPKKCLLNNMCNCSVNPVYFKCNCNCENCIYNKNDYIKLLPQYNHLKLNFDARDDINNNKNIIESFNDLFKNYRVVIHSVKGSIFALITTLHNYSKYYNDYWAYSFFDLDDPDLPYIKYIQYSGDGTVSIICEIIESIHNFDDQFMVCLKCNKVENKDIIQTNVNNKICKSCDISEYSRVYLEVPFNDKNQIKNLGGKFDGLYKKWYVGKNNLNDYILSKWKRIKIIQK
jgi:hypothetical protein